MTIIEPEELKTSKWIGFVIDGKISAGYYNAMEATPCFYLNNEMPIDELIADKLKELGYDPDLSYDPFKSAKDVGNPLVGCRCRITIEFEAPETKEKRING